MARKQKIETDLLISLIDRYWIEKCNKNIKKLKIPEIGLYIRNSGYDVADYLIRRNTEAVDYINKLKNSNEEVHLYTVSVYRDIELDAFFEKNNTKEKMKKAIKEREQYYREITHSAFYSFEENKKLKSKISDLQQQKNTLENELSEKIKENNENILKIKKNIDYIHKLKKIIDTYVYPEIANELLKKDGLIYETSNIINNEILDKNIITAEKDIEQIKNNVIRNLFKNV